MGGPKDSTGSTTGTLEPGGGADHLEKALGHLRMPRRWRSPLVIGGALCVLVGYFGPWWQFVYSPPAAFAKAHPAVPPPNVVYDQFYSGLSIMWYNSGLNGQNTNYTLVRASAGLLGAGVVLLLLGLISAAASLSGHPVRNVVRHVLSWLLHAGGVALTLWLTVSHAVNGASLRNARAQFAADYGGTATSRQASQYLHIHYQWGFVVMLLGFAMSLAIYTRERRLSEAEFGTRSRLYRATATWFGKLGDLVASALFMLVIIAVSVVAAVYLFQWIHRAIPFGHAVTPTPTPDPSAHR
ncbi:hypothetical protein [Rugosimonospora acidiphila]|uniref:hypothetical protein n=1 Tax=Rugosimonospora acidiphila TaxID=556531 RepID=UPI0031E616C1